MKIDRARIPTLLLHNNNVEQPIFTLTQWNTFCDTINSSLQIYNIVIKTHSKKVVSRLLIFPMASFTFIAIILILFGRPYLGLGIFASTVVISVIVCLYDRCRVDRAYECAIGNLKSVVEKINEEGMLAEDCGVVLSVVVTGPTTNDNDNSNQDNNSSDKWNWAGRNNITNVYIECTRINTPQQDQDDNDQLLERGPKKKQQQQRKKSIDNIVYNQDEASFSC